MDINHLSLGFIMMAGNDCIQRHASVKVADVMLYIVESRVMASQYHLVRGNLCVVFEDKRSSPFTDEEGSRSISRLSYLKNGS